MKALFVAFTIVSMWLTGNEFKPQSREIVYELRFNDAQMGYHMGRYYSQPTYVNMLKNRGYHIAYSRYASKHNFSSNRFAINLKATLKNPNDAQAMRVPKFKG